MSNPAATPSDRRGGTEPAQPPAGQPAQPPAAQPSSASAGTSGRKPAVPSTGQGVRPTEKLHIPRTGKGSGTDGGQGGKQPDKSRAKPYKSSDDWGVFRAVVIAVGILIAAVGVYYLVTGTAGVSDTGGGEVNPSLESQFRFFSAMMVGVGAAFIAIAVKFQWANMLWLVCLMVFLGGIGRVLSWAFSGTPHYTMIILMIVELAFPPALLVWHRFIAKTSELKREFSEGSAGRSDGAAAGGTQG
ncbi:DUF4345 domain-containing protein [Arthrobacter sp. ATA002]|uniref:DUF4345 domain-containing protein n=1 Tax=Arthrobacter sp. ATA002 TaxID=2991715 RepID=UPI0022A6B7BB|nr:DUF4345 domain-containing protein [Arthrobacter sp. ATA002]WAP51034.1 DUF4345 domain-containing protein [Arthrobacter sp. ATA002]